MVFSILLMVIVFHDDFGFGVFHCTLYMLIISLQQLFVLAVVCIVNLEAKPLWFLERSQPGKKGPCFLDLLV